MAALVEAYWSLELFAAICVKSFLESRDIPVFLWNEHHITQSSGVLGLALGGYRVMVVDHDAIKAFDLLKAAEANEYRLDDDFDESLISRW